MGVHRIAVIPADGVGREVVPAALYVLRQLQERCNDFQLITETFAWGSDYYRSTGRMMAENGLVVLRDFDAILFGAVGDQTIADDITLWGLRLKICQSFDQYANVRPIRLLPGVASPLSGVRPADLDWVIVRENSEGEYAGNGGRTHRGLPEEVATETAIFTRNGTERIMRFAFALAQRRQRKRLTIVTKSNAQRFGLVLWDEIAAEIGREFPDVAVDKWLVDAMTTRMVLAPHTLDTIVATNLHADILSDLAAALAGSLGLAATANINPERRFPSMFEPIHGTAFDIAGKSIANPIGTIWSSALMLEHLGEHAAARRLMQAIERVASEGQALPADLGGKATTTQVAEAVADAVRSADV
jgi:tartrate dehydrogenase/decarboxylase/D-malate dehydrogenase